MAHATIVIVIVIVIAIKKTYGSIFYSQSNQNRGKSLKNEEGDILKINMMITSNA